MSVTAVPLRPIERRALVWLWLGLGLLALLGIAGAFYATRNIAAPAKVFLARNAKQPGVVVTPSGLQYQVLAAGSGARPTASDLVLINYVGSLADGTVFDQGKMAPLAVGRTVPGFSEALMLMPVGSKYRLWIPPALGYPEGNGPIPPNSLLIFDVDLLAVAPQSAMGPPRGMPPSAAMPPPAGGMPEGVVPQGGEMPAEMPTQSAEPSAESPPQ
jgi:hypothetical protein